MKTLGKGVVSSIEIVGAISATSSTRNCEESKISQCLMLKEVMDSIENSADKCEDVADVLRSIALLSI